MQTANQNDYHQRILHTLMFIQKHLDDDLSLETLADIACFSPFHFHRIFRALVGESVMAHIRRLRLERAAWHLRDTDDAIITIALEAGFESHEAFSRAFKHMFKLAPREFRQIAGSCQSDSASGVHYLRHGMALNYHSPRKGDVHMNVSIVTRQPLNVAFVRHIGPYAECGNAWNALCAWAMQNNLFRENTEFVGVSYDDPKITPPEKLRYDACISVPEDCTGKGEIAVQTLAGGPYAQALHKGPYDKLIDVYNYLYGQWLPQSGKQLRDLPPLEFYRNNPQDTAPEDLLTEIFIPLAH